MVAPSGRNVDQCQKFPVNNNIPNKWPLVFVLTITVYQILSTRLTLDTDAPSCPALFDGDYHRFRIADKPLPHPSCGPTLTVCIRLNTPNPHVRVNGRHYPLDGHPQPDHYALQLLQWALFSNMDAFVMAHAGVVSHKGRWAVIAGPPGAGKSTLVLALVDAGCLFLSDEIAPIHKTTGLVHPFPRTVWVRPDADGDPKPSPEGLDFLRPGKIPMPLSEEVMGDREAPRKPAMVICLEPERPARREMDIRIGFKPGGHEGFVSLVKGLGRRLSSGEEWRAAPLDFTQTDWRVTCPENMETAEAMTILLEELSDRAWNIYRESRVAPDFDRPPALLPLATHETCLRLLSDLKLGSPLIPMSQRLGGDAPGALFLAVAEALCDVGCYRLVPGRLPLMVNMVKQLMETS